MGLRDRLRNRQLPQATVGIRLDWSEESYTLLAKADIAEERLRLAAESDPDMDLLRTSAEEARARADEFYEMLTVKALPATDFENLVALHPPDEEQQKTGFSFNRHTFFPALLASCVEGTETEEEWSEMIQSGALVAGELGTLIGVAMSLNDRSPSVTLGKGSTTTSS